MNKTKKRNLSVILEVLATVVLFAACQKSNVNNPPTLSPHRVIVESRNGEKTISYLLVTQIGHDAKTCNGCVLFEGKMIHKDCMRHGNYCRYGVSVVIDTLGGCITATTVDTFDLTSENFFAMPARSLYYYTEDNNNHVYLNIPEQMVYRDTATLQFTFTGLFLTNVPEYSND